MSRYSRYVKKSMHRMIVRTVRAVAKVEFQGVCSAVGAGVTEDVGGCFGVWEEEGAIVRSEDTAEVVVVVGTNAGVVVVLGSSSENGKSEMSSVASVIGVRYTVV